MIHTFLSDMMFTMGWDGIIQLTTLRRCPYFKYSNISFHPVLCFLHLRVMMLLHTIRLPICLAGHLSRLTTSISLVRFVERVGTVGSGAKPGLSPFPRFPLEMIGQLASFQMLGSFRARVPQSLPTIPAPTSILPLSVLFLDHPSNQPDKTIPLTSLG